MSDLEFWLKVTGTSIAVFVFFGFILEATKSRSIEWFVIGITMVLGFASIWLSLIMVVWSL